MLRERIQKADGLEETVRRQELVIEKLEAMITNYMKEKRLRGRIRLCRRRRSRDTGIVRRVQRRGQNVPYGARGYRHRIATASSRSDGSMQERVFHVRGVCRDE